MSDTGLRFFEIENFDEGAVISPLATVKSFADEDVRDEWDELFDAIDNLHVKNLVLDLGRLSFFGSTMLEWIIVLGKRVKQHDGRMIICNASQPTLEVLHIAKFDTLWPIETTRQDALNKLRKT